MSNFYGVIQGSRGAATRQGSSIFKTTAASYDGAVRVVLRRGKDGINKFSVRMTRWLYSQNVEYEIASGVMGELPETATTFLDANIQRIENGEKPKARRFKKGELEALLEQRRQQVEAEMLRRENEAYMRGRYDTYSEAWEFRHEQLQQETFYHEQNKVVTTSRAMDITP